MNTDLVAIAQRALSTTTLEGRAEIAKDLLDLAVRVTYPTVAEAAIQRLLDEEAELEAQFASEPWTDDQRRAMFAMLGNLGDNGSNGRDHLRLDRWDLASMLLGRRVQSFTDLTKADASRILDGLNVIV